MQAMSAALFSTRAASDAAHSGRLALDNGHVMAWSDVGPRSAPVALLLHGGPGSGRSGFMPTCFDAARWRIVAYDQRGSGQSTPAGETRHNQTDDLLADLRALRAHLGIERWLVVGGSWGATLALLHAADAPEAVDGLLLRGVFLARRDDVEHFFDASAHGLPDPWVPWRRAGEPLAVSLDRVLVEGGDAARRCVQIWWRWEQALDGVDAPPIDGDALIAQMQRYRVQAHYLRQGCGLDERPLLDRLAAVPKVPTLLLHGTRDRICPPEGARAVHERLSGSVLRWIDGGHAPTQAAMTHALRGAIDEYLGTRAWSPA